MNTNTKKLNKNSSSFNYINPTNYPITHRNITTRLLEAKGQRYFIISPGARKESSGPVFQLFKVTTVDFHVQEMHLRGAIDGLEKLALRFVWGLTNVPSKDLVRNCLSKKERNSNEASRDAMIGEKDVVPEATKKKKKIW